MTSHPPVRWGFLGAGMVATAALAPATHRADGAVLAAAAARDPERAARLEPAVVHESYDALLDDPDVEAVYISLTNEAHLPWTLAALERGKHVLCEKPLGLSAAEVDEMATAAEAAGRIVVEASWYRWHPRIRAARAMLADLGPVTTVDTGFTFDHPAEGGYRLEPERGGGALYDVGHYAVSACLWAVNRGLPHAVESTSVLGPTGVDLDTRAVLHWPGAVAHAHAGLTGGAGQWLRVGAERGSVELHDAPFTSWKDDTTTLRTISDGRVDEVSFPPTDAYQTMVEEVSSVLRGGPGWVLPLAASRDTADVLDRCRAAAFRGDAGR